MVTGPAVLTEYRGYITGYYASYWLWLMARTGVIDPRLQEKDDEVGVFTSV